MRPILVFSMVPAACAAFLGGARADDAVVVKPVRAVASLVTGEKRVDHAAWQGLLTKYVNAAGLVDYKTWKAKDAATLDRYLQGLAKVDPAKLADTPERLAFWINAYNALTIKGMLKFYPTKSIKKHTSRLWGFHFWDDVRIAVGGTERSLDHIEHKILRKQSEPRIHFAIVCASKGCPRLRNSAYTGPKLESQLADAAREFFASSKHFRVTVGSTTVKASKILDWFGADFGGSTRKILDYARAYVADPAVKAWLARADLELAWLDYDWAINQQKAVPNKLRPGRAR